MTYRGLKYNTLLLGKWSNQWRQFKGLSRSVYGGLTVSESLFSVWMGKNVESGPCPGPCILGSFTSRHLPVHWNDFETVGRVASEWWWVRVKGLGSVWGVPRGVRTVRGRVVTRKSFQRGKCPSCQRGERDGGNSEDETVGGHRVGSHYDLFVLRGHGVTRVGISPVLLSWTE